MYNVLICNFILLFLYSEYKVYSKYEVFHL